MPSFAASLKTNVVARISVSPAAVNVFLLFEEVTSMEFFRTQRSTNVCVAAVMLIDAEIEIK